MKRGIVGLIVSLLFAAVTAGAFYWLWGTSKLFPVETSVASNLKPIEIESIKNEAKTLLEGLSKNSDIPISVPTAKMGKPNPFQ